MNFLKIAAIATTLAGISHLTLQASSHFGMHFYFASFIAIGLTQISLGVLLWKNKLSPQIFWLTAIVNGTATVFWLLTRTMSAPFIGGVEHFSILGIAVVSLQVLSILLLCVERKNLLLLIYVLIGSTALGFASHFGATQMETYFPAMKGTGGHHGGGHHSNMNSGDQGVMMDHQEKTTDQPVEPSKTTTPESVVEGQADDDHDDQPHGH